MPFAETGSIRRPLRRESEVFAIRSCARRSTPGTCQSAWTTLPRSKAVGAGRVSTQHWGSSSPGLTFNVFPRAVKDSELFQPRSHRSNPLLLPMPRREHSQPKRVSTVGQPAWCRRTGREVEVDATCARHARTPRNRLRIEGRNQEASPHRAMTATIWPDVQETHPRDAKGLDSRPFLPCPETYPLWDNRTPHSVMIVISSLQLEAVSSYRSATLSKTERACRVRTAGTAFRQLPRGAVLCACLQDLVRVRSNRRT